MVTKTVKGLSADLTRSFDFTVTLGQAATGYVRDIGATTGGTAYTFAANVATTVPLKNGQQLVVEGLTPSTICSVAEAGMDTSYQVAGYDVTATKKQNADAATNLDTRTFQNASLVNGTTVVAYTNTYPDIVISGVHLKLYELVLIATAVVLLAAFAVTLSRARRMRARKASARHASRG